MSRTPTGTTGAAATREIPGMLRSVLTDAWARR